MLVDALGQKCHQRAGIFLAHRQPALRFLQLMKSVTLFCFKLMDTGFESRIAFDFRQP